jgi:hypothetical protein
VNNDIQKDWLKIQRMCRDLTWMTYGDDYKDIPELKEALILLKKSKDLLKKIIEED